MKTRHWILALLILPLGWSHAIEWDASTFMSLDEIRPGMKAKAHTVFSGTEVETFDVEIVSVRKSGQGRHVIWGLGQGDRIEHTGVAQGMSGSPVYIKNRLIGAIAYTYSNVKDAWVGITPVEEMLPILDRDMTPRLSHGGFTFGIDRYLETMAAFQEGDIRWPEPAGARETFNTSPEMLQIPLMFTGFQQQAFEHLKPFFRGRNMSPVQGNGTAQQDVAYSLEPGQLAAMVYATGDQALYGYGTVTYRQGDQFLAFGHPASNEGHTHFPIAGGWVDQVVASRVISFKAGSIGKVTGTLVQDRMSGIAGIIGTTPEMVPLKVRLNPHSGIPREFNYQVFMGDEQLAASIAATLVLNAVESAERAAGDYTVDVGLSIDIEGQTSIVRNATGVGTASPASTAALALYAPLAAIVSNEFAPLSVQRMQVDVTLRDNRHIAQIREVRLNKTMFRPGEDIQATVVFQPYLDQVVTERVMVHIPEDAEDGQMSLLVTNAASHLTWQRTRAPEKYRPRNVEQLMNILREGESGYNLITELSTPKLGMTIQGEEYPELPFSMLYVMSSPAQSGEGGFTRGTTLSVQTHPMPYVIIGSRTLRISVDRNAH